MKIVWIVSKVRKATVWHICLLLSRYGKRQRGACDEQTVPKSDREISEYKNGTRAAIQHCSNILGSTFKHMSSLRNEASVLTQWKEIFCPILRFCKEPTGIPWRCNSSSTRACYDDGNMVLAVVCRCHFPSLLTGDSEINHAEMVMVARHLSLRDISRPGWWVPRRHTNQHMIVAELEPDSQYPSDCNFDCGSISRLAWGTGVQVNTIIDLRGGSDVR
jgi:hypothetical protein